MSAPLRLLLRFALTTTLVAVLVRAFPAYLVITGGWTALIAIGALLTLLNLFVRPLLNAVTLPLKLLFSLPIIILVNVVFLLIVKTITGLYDPSIASLTIGGGLTGWLTVALTLGIGNWAIVHVL